MNIIVVEDEVDILRGIVHVIESSGVMFERILAAHTAEAALQLMEEHRPEIVLTDIMLPKMSGLDMLDNVQAFGYRPKVIVISSYSNFIYAQRSIQLGAVDYLLKPVNREELIGKLVTIYAMVRNEQISSEQMRSQTVYARLGTESLKEQFVQGLCLQKTPLQEHIHHRLQMWELQWLETRSYALLSISTERGNSGAKRDQDIDLELFAIGNIAGEALKQFQPSVIIRSIHHDWIIITAWEQEREVAEATYRQVVQFSKIAPVIGMSERQHSFQAMAEAYEQARQAMRFAILESSRPIVGYDEIAVGGESDSAVSRFIVDAVLDGNAEQLDGWLEESLRRLMRAKDVGKIGDLAVKCFEWMLEIHSSLAEKLDIDISRNLLEFWEKMECCRSTDDLKRLLQEHVGELIQAIGTQGQQQLSEPNFIIDRAKRIIDKKYGEAITLQSVAQELNIHPVWLSRLFKRETGQNFLDYITDIRMEKAKELLRHTSLKIYEIAEEIGYQEIQYFGKLFKKRMNMTPKEFRYGK